MGLFDKLFKNNNKNELRQPKNENIERAHELPPEYRDETAPAQATPRTVTYYDPPEQHVHIIIDSLNLINKTTNPETYFYRYRLASNEAIRISDFNKVIYNGMTPKQIYDWLNDKTTKIRLEKEFIDKLFEIGKEDLIVFQMDDVGYKMTKETRNYYVEKLAGKEFHFCKVKFDVNSNKLYTYVVKDKSVTVGDTISVPTGNSFVPESKVVQVVEVYDDSIDNLPFDLPQLRCVERKLKGIECPHCGASISIDVGQKTGKCNHCGAEFFLLQ